MSAFYDPRFRRLLDWTEARRAGITDAPVPFADDESLDAVMWIESFLDAAEVVARIEPPASLRSRLQMAFANQHRRDDEQSVGFATLGLLADSRHPSELVGVRGSATRDGQAASPLLSGGEPATAFVEVRPTSAVSVRITGQFVDHRGDPPGRGSPGDHGGICAATGAPSAALLSNARQLLGHGPSAAGEPASRVPRSGNTRRTQHRRARDLPSRPRIADRAEADAALRLIARARRA